MTVDHVDEATLAEAARVLGTRNPGDTVNAALQEVIRSAAVGSYVKHLKGKPSDPPDADREDAWR